MLAWDTNNYTIADIHSRLDWDSTKTSGTGSSLDRCGRSHIFLEQLTFCFDGMGVRTPIPLQLCLPNAIIITRCNYHIIFNYIVPDL